MINDKFVVKLDQLLPNLNNELKTAFLHIKRDKRYKTYTAKFDMVLPGHKQPFYAENSSDDLTFVITGLREQVEKQIKKYKHA